MNRLQAKDVRGVNGKSQKGKNLLFTVVTRPLFVHDKIRLLPFAAALAAADGIEQETKSAVECKWPNDLLIDGKKIAGMLIETTTQNDAVMNVILGIGINVNQTEFPADIKEKATSLKLHSQQDDRPDPLALCSFGRIGVPVRSVAPFFAADAPRRVETTRNDVGLGDHARRTSYFDKGEGNGCSSQRRPRYRRNERDEA